MKTPISLEHHPKKHSPIKKDTKRCVHKLNLDTTNKFKFQKTRKQKVDNDEYNEYKTTVGKRNKLRKLIGNGIMKRRSRKARKKVRFSDPIYSNIPDIDYGNDNTTIKTTSQTLKETALYVADKLRQKGALRFRALSNFFSQSSSS